MRASRSYRMCSPRSGATYVTKDVATLALHSVDIWPAAEHCVALAIAPGSRGKLVAVMRAASQQASRSLGGLASRETLLVRSLMSAARARSTIAISLMRTSTLCTSSPKSVGLRVSHRHHRGRNRPLSMAGTRLGALSLRSLVRVLFPPLSARVGPQGHPSL